MAGGGSLFLLYCEEKEVDMSLSEEVQRKEAQRTWYATEDGPWCEGLVAYWRLLKPKRVILEEDMEALYPEQVQAFDESEWFDFLRERYFRWKYTAPNRYASTTKWLEGQAEEIGLGGLLGIRDEILVRGAVDTRSGMEAALKIKGLGPAGASGLLSLVFPDRYGAVDQFVVKFLLLVEDLPEAANVEAMNPESLKLDESLLLLEILQRKAKEMNEEFQMSSWTPRRIDKVLWALGH